MDEHPTASGLSPDKLAQLWNIGSETDQAEPDLDQDDRKIELLQDLLAGTLPTNLSRAKSHNKDHRNRRSVVHSLVDKTIDKILQIGRAHV